MTIKYCPECGAKISSQAIQCHYCGYYNNNFPIGIDNKYNDFKWEISDTQSDFIFPMSLEQNNEFNKFFGTAENLENLAQIAPSLYEAIKSTFKNTEYTVDLTKEIQQKIKDGTYKFIIDKSGNILAQLKDQSGKIVHNCRILKENIPLNLSPALCNLAMQVTLVSIVIEIKKVKEQIAKLTESIQKDRYALVDAALQNLQQAEVIHDARVREMLLINTLNLVEEAKCKLFLSYPDVNNKVNKKINNPFHSQTKIDKNNQDFFECLYKIFQSVYIKTKIYCWLGEQEAAKLLLHQFNEFLTKYEINKQSLLKINSQTNENWEPFENLINNFDESIERIRTKILDIPKNNLLLLPEPKEYKYD